PVDAGRAHGPPAVEVGLHAVFLVVGAPRRGAYVVGAGAALAVDAVHAALTLGAFVGAGSAAIGVCLAAVLDAVGAGGRHAHAVDADATLAILGYVAGLACRALHARAAAVDIALVVVGDAVAASAGERNSVVGGGE